MQIKVKDLKFTYSPKSKSISASALNGVSLTVNEGEFFGIIGHTGSGKSTFIQHLNGLIKMQENSGELTVGEFDLSKKCDYKQLRAKVGMVFQYPEHQLFAETVFEDVAFGLKNFYPELNDEQIVERVKNAIESVGLDYESIKDKSPFEMSGGQKRRVAIAGVIVSEPEVLVLDEPVAGLDPKGKRELLKLLHGLHKKFVKTIIIVSHDMDVVAEHCTSVAVFKKGKVVCQGLPKTVFTAEKVKEFGLEMPLIANLTKALLVDEQAVDLTVNGFVSAVAKLKGVE